MIITKKHAIFSTFNFPYIIWISVLTINFCWVVSIHPPCGTYWVQRHKQSTDTRRVKSSIIGFKLPLKWFTYIETNVDTLLSQPCCWIITHYLTISQLWFSHGYFVNILTLEMSINTIRKHFLKCLSENVDILDFRLNTTTDLWPTFQDSYDTTRVYTKSYCKDDWHALIKIWNA